MPVVSCRGSASCSSDTVTIHPSNNRNYDKLNEPHSISLNQISGPTGGWINLARQCGPYPVQVVSPVLYPHPDQTECSRDSKNYYTSTPTDVCESGSLRYQQKIKSTATATLTFSESRSNFTWSRRFNFISIINESYSIDKSVFWFWFLLGTIVNHLLSTFCFKSWSRARTCSQMRSEFQ